MGDGLQIGLGAGAGAVKAPVRAAQVAREVEVRQSANGVHFATYGETGVAVPDLTKMLEAVPPAISSALKDNTYYFVPLALRETPESLAGAASGGPGVVKSSPHQSAEPAMIAGEYSDEFSDAAICHRDVELGDGHRGVFISTRLLGDRFALSFEFFINVAHAYVDAAGVPERFAELAWQQALANVRGETSMDAWESRSLALGRPPQADPEPAPVRRRKTYVATARAFSQDVPSVSAAANLVADEKERQLFLDAAFSDALAIYLLSLSLDFDYSELREREYPLLQSAALGVRLKLIAELFPPNAGYEFALRYRRRA